MDCPRCEAKLKGVMKLPKNKRIPLQRRYKGGIITSVRGDTRKQTVEGMKELPPDGMTVTDECKSCHWKSTKRYDRHNRKWIYS